MCVCEPSIDNVTGLNAMNRKSKSGERALVVVLEQRVEVDLLDPVHVTRKQRRDLLASTVRRLGTKLYIIYTALTTS